jgi:hypothetical protein
MRDESARVAGLGKIAAALGLTVVTPAAGPLEQPQQTKVDEHQQHQERQQDHPHQQQQLQMQCKQHTGPKLPQPAVFAGAAGCGVRTAGMQRQQQATPAMPAAMVPSSSTTAAAASQAAAALRCDAQRLQADCTPWELQPSKQPSKQLQVQDSVAAQQQQQSEQQHQQALSLRLGGFAALDPPQQKRHQDDKGLEQVPL